MFPDKTATKRNGTALIAYAVQTVVQNVLVAVRQSLIENRHTLFGFLPVGCRDDQTGKARDEDGLDMSAYGF